MGFSHKTAIIRGTVALENWVAANEIAEKVDWAGFRNALATLNPELHECLNDACSVDTWSGTDDDCPACHTRGEKTGRLVK